MVHLKYVCITKIQNSLKNVSISMIIIAAKAIWFSCYQNPVVKFYFSRTTALNKGYLIGFIKNSGGEQSALFL